ncbi:MAG: arginine--tRNA ligase [Bacteroidales bacterium]|jgi:arginyl-tRNA synthetase|nr:arginine--tRNA ligase [Bacteroidales bacterium]
MFTQLLAQATSDIASQLWNQQVAPASIQIEKTPSHFEGDVTIVVFPFVKMARLKPEDTAQAIGAALAEKISGIDRFNVVKGFLNITFTPAFWLSQMSEAAPVAEYSRPEGNDAKTIVLEYSSPNTNKPLHLGHIRNNLLGWSLAEVYKAAGHNVIKANLINDRGIHICKTMVAYNMWGNNETPESAGVKGDHLIGKYYVLFDKANKEEAAELGIEKPEDGDTPLMKDARAMLRDWEKGEPHVMALWNKLNSWVIDGFNDTYARLGVDFDKVYRESETYLSGKDIVQKGLAEGHLQQDPDGSVWIDLTDEGLDRKILLRSDGTTVYMTQDIGTAVARHNDFGADKMVYVVGNEQIYHFDVLKKTLKRLGYDWADNILHYSYGMVELPEGKMKSREGTVVDADDLLDEMKQTAADISKEAGKAQDLPAVEQDRLHEMIGQGALKYFILRVDPKKNMLFNPSESIDFNGNTGPFIQYTHARICSVLNKGSEAGIAVDALKWFADAELKPQEKELLYQLLTLPQMTEKAANNESPAVVANYSFELAQMFNSMYQEISILREPDETLRNNRLLLAKRTAETLKFAMGLLGVGMPEKM